MIYLSKEQFDDATPDFSGRGFNFSITIGDVAFKVRNYSDMPGEFTVVNPKEARQSPQARQLVDYLGSVLGGRRMFFYDGRSETYREVNLQTLKFNAYEKTSFDTTREPALLRAAFYFNPAAAPA
jgi:hypothetical protein